jgi:sulfatase maturation enzyme AslB (radical SAM superfamily)
MWYDRRQDRSNGWMDEAITAQSDGDRRAELAKLKRTMRAGARVVRTVARNALTRQRFGDTYPAEDRALFGAVAETWRPQSGVPANSLRWTVTEWCNFHCAYCWQKHERRAPTPGGFTAHAFDNFPVERWMGAFEQHFGKRRLSLVITGGEPMLDHANMNVILAFLTAASWCESIRIDTNASWLPRKFDGLAKHKIALNCSYHPSQIDEDKYFRNLAAIQQAGFTIGMVNFVLSRSQRDSASVFR